MGILKRNRDPRKALRGFAILVAIALVAFAVRFVSNGFSTKPKEERGAEKVFAAWLDEHLAGYPYSDIKFELSEWFPEYGAYTDTCYPAIMQRMSVLKTASEFADLDSGTKKSMLDFQRRFVTGMESLDSLRSRSSLEAERQKLSFYETLSGKNADECVAAIDKELKTLKDSADVIEKRHGWMKTYTCNIADEGRFVFVFLSPKEKPDSIALFNVNSLNEEINPVLKNILDGIIRIQ